MSQSLSIAHYWCCGKEEAANALAKATWGPWIFVDVLCDVVKIKGLGGLHALSFLLDLRVFMPNSFIFTTFVRQTFCCHDKSKAPSSG